MDEMTKEEIESYKKALLQKYHNKKEDLEFAADEMEEGWIEDELEEYRAKIRACATRIKEMDGEDDQ
jgi:hypothetical protein